MKYLKRYILKGMGALMLIFTIPVITFAQPGNPCDYQNPDVYCPMDNGLLVLFAVMLFYGFVRYATKKTSGKVL